MSIVLFHMQLLLQYRLCHTFGPWKVELMKRIVLVRHGESEANLKCASTVSGQSIHTPLTAVGKAQVNGMGPACVRHNNTPWF